MNVVDTEAIVRHVRPGTDGLIPTVIVGRPGGDVLMVGFMNEAALRATLETGYVHFWSRSRQALWKKGETSGNMQRVLGLRINCEQNTLLVEVEQIGAVCHDGYPTCFYRQVQDDGTLVTVETRAFDPASVYGPDARPGRAGNLLSIVERWLGAYEWLRDHPLEAVSSTSRRLRTGEDVRVRVADELDELAGVLDGTHRHRDAQADLRLEAGQVLYWLALVGVGNRLPDLGRAYASALLDAWRPLAAAEQSVVLRSLAMGWRAPEAGDLPARLAVTVSAVAAPCLTGGVAPDEVLRADLDTLASRPYLAEWREAENWSVSH